MPILEVHHIEKHFGATRVLEDISFDLEQGQALAIIGSSGSGKTTLLRCLNFLETPDQGHMARNMPRNWKRPARWRLTTGCSSRRSICLRLFL